MINWQQFRVDVVQTALFLRDQDFTPARALAAILPRYSERFDGEMQVLPLPAGILPAEIPPVTLQSREGHWRLSMGPGRIDSVWTNKPPPTETNLSETVRQCTEVLAHYVSETQVPVARLALARLALVVQRVCLVDNPAQMLIDRFCNESSHREPFNRSETFEIHNHKVYTQRSADVEWPINSWVRCKTAKLLADNRPVILVEQDLNTLANENEPRNLDIAQIPAFFAMAAAEADDILRKYFPREELPCP